MRDFGVAFFAGARRRSSEGEGRNAPFTKDGFKGVRRTYVVFCRCNVAVTPYRRSSVLVLHMGMNAG